MDGLAHKRHTEMTALVPVSEKGNDVAGEKFEKILSADELREAVRAVQRERLEALERECAEREAFRKANTKLHPQQKRILRWLWEKTRKHETYLEENDLGSPSTEYAKRMDSLREEDGFDLDGAHGDAAKWREYIDYHDAYFFSCTGGGLSWSISAITGRKPTKTEKSSLSRSLKHLIERDLVRRSPVFNNYVVLTPLGRSVCKRLTPC